MTYLEMCNEVLVRMREEEIESVKDSNNDPQQKIICTFVNDAKTLLSAPIHGMQPAKCG